jgi:hypothetical protein
MARRLSEVLGVRRVDLKREGAFDGFVDIDSPFHIDPHLLRSVKVPELKKSYQRFKEYFTKIIRLLDASRSKDDRFYREVIKLLMFPEISHIKLGYSLSGSPGSGIGLHLAIAIAHTAKQLVDAGIKDPEIFELVGLLEEGIGADRISDMTIQIILPDLLCFSQRVAQHLKIRTISAEYQNKQYEVPLYPISKKPIILVPHEILRHLPVALDWSEIDVVCAYNEALRATVNALIGRTWKEARQKHTKREIMNVVLRYPDLMKELVKIYASKTGMQYDFDRDPEGLISWSDIATRFATQHPLTFGLLQLTDDVTLLACVRAICDQFGTLIEDNGLNELLYDKGKLKHERFAQLLFYGIADSYCAANNLDLSREPNAGRGPVDFKLSQGYRAKVNVEVKYSSNTALVRGFTNQLPDYDKAEKTQHSIYLILKTTQSTASIKAVKKTADIAKQQGKRSPDIIIVEAERKPSASKKERK